MRGVVGPLRRDLPIPQEVTNLDLSLTILERRPEKVTALVSEKVETSGKGFPSTARHVEPCGNPGGPSSKAKY